MTTVRTFRDLIAWQKGMSLAKLVYHASEELPQCEIYGLTSQMRRCAVSVPSNIAEGHGREKRADYLRHLRIARGSLCELSTQMELATALNLLHPNEELDELLSETDRVLQGLIRSLERKHD